MISYVLIVVLLCMFLFYVHFVKPMNYWKERKVFHVSAFGKFFQVFFSRKSLFEITLEIYRRYPDRRFYGSYQFLEPSLFVRDLDLIKEITTNDFDHFTDNFTFFDQKSDPIIGQNLFELKGERWKNMRAILSPAFSSSKMKGMFPFIQETSERFANHFSNRPEDTIELEMKEEFSKFSNDVIATCVFGIDCNSLKNENMDFFAMGHQVVNPTAGTKLRLFLKALFPQIFEIFEIPVFPQSLIDFFQKIVKNNMEHRENNNIVRQDMIQQLLEAKRGRLKYDDDYLIEESILDKSVPNMELTDDLIMAQLLVFFIAGFDTTSSLLSILCYQLAIDQHVHKTLQSEIDKVMTECNGKLSYEDVLNMKYLDQVVSEALRRYPLGYVLTKRCVKNYKIEAYKRSEKSFVLEKGTLVTLPVVGIHMDPILFPHPEMFDPDRFSDENKEKIVPGSYMPFGSGPRSCIGSRFALLQCKTLMIHLLWKFDITLTKKTRIPLRFAKTINLTSKDGFWLGLKQRKTENC